MNFIKKNPNLTFKELFKSGMNVGRDVMGTMSTTLILAFFGGSLGVWVLDYVYDLPYLQLMNSNSIGIEIMQVYLAVLALFSLCQSLHFFQHGFQII